jgi:hypothetical protein
VGIIVQQSTIICFNKRIGSNMSVTKEITMQAVVPPAHDAAAPAVVTIPSMTHATFIHNASLPYIDADPTTLVMQHNDGTSAITYEEYARHAIEQEMKHTMIQPQLPPMPPLRTRHVERELLEDLTSAFPDPPTEETVEAWTAAVKQARICYESERLRRQRLLLDLGKTEQDTTSNEPTATAADAWKAWISQVQFPMHAEIAGAALHEQTARVQAVLAERQQWQQSQVGPELHRLTQQHAQVHASVNQLQQAQAQLVRDIHQMQQEQQS